MLKILLTALALTGTVMTIQAGNQPDIKNWIEINKVKASYTWMSKWHHKNPEKVVSDLHDAGFNSIFLKAGNDPEQRKLWLDSAAKYNLKIFICYNYWSKGINIDSPEAGFRHAVYKTGQISAAPCPMNYAYWQKQVLPQALEFAELSLKYDCLAGLLLDTEMYGIKPHAFLEDVCFCDDCFGKFMQKINSREQIAPGKRCAWLQENKLLKAYYEQLENRFAETATKFREDIHTKNPQLVLGNLNYVDTWFFRGLLKGFGTKELPALSAPESPTYRQGYIPFVNKQQQKFKREKIHVFYVPGIWNICFYPEALASNCYKLAINSDGYFDFTARALYGLIPEFTPVLMKKSGNDLQKYWNAFKDANNEISKKMQDKNYQSPLNKADENIADKIIKVSPAPVSGNYQALTDSGTPVTWNVDETSGTVTIIIELKEKTKVKRVRAQCQGGGTPSSLYFPGKMKVYYTEYNGSADSAAEKAEWIQASVANEPDNQFSFKENGHHSAGAYRRWMTATMPIRSIETRFIKIDFCKQPDAYAAEVTKINKKQVKQMQILKIEII